MVTWVFASSSDDDAESPNITDNDNEERKNHNYYVTKQETERKDVYKFEKTLRPPVYGYSYWL